MCLCWPRLLSRQTSSRDVTSVTERREGGRMFSGFLRKSFINTWYLFVSSFIIVATYCAICTAAVTHLSRELYKGNFRLSQRSRWEISDFCLPGPRIQSCWHLKMRPTACPETSIRNCHYLLLNNPEERSSVHRIKFVQKFYKFIPPLLLQSRGRCSSVACFKCTVGVFTARYEFYLSTQFSLNSVS
jgi:hypothetical protein